MCNFTCPIRKAKFSQGRTQGKGDLNAGANAFGGPSFEGQREDEKTRKRASTCLFSPCPSSRFRCKQTVLRARRRGGRLRKDYLLSPFSRYIAAMIHVGIGYD